MSSQVTTTPADPPATLPHPPSRDAAIRHRHGATVTGMNQRGSVHAIMDDHHNSAALAWAWTIGWCICYPIGYVLWYLLVVTLFVLNLLYHPVAFLLQPVVYLGRFTLACLVFPFTLATRFETIYIYLGVAAIVGLLGGLFMRGTYNTLKSILQLDARPEPKLRSAKQYREEKKRKQKMKVEMPPLLSPGHLSPGPLSPGYLSMSDSARKGKQKGLLAQTILEEDSDF